MKDTFDASAVAGWRHILVDEHGAAGRIGVIRFASFFDGALPLPEYAGQRVKHAVARASGDRAARGEGVFFVDTTEHKRIRCAQP